MVDLKTQNAGLMDNLAELSETNERLQKQVEALGAGQGSAGSSSGGPNGAASSASASPALERKHATLAKQELEAARQAHAAETAALKVCRDFFFFCPTIATSSTPLYLRRSSPSCEQRSARPSKSTCSC